MRKHLMASVAAAGVIGAAGAAASAGTYIPVPMVPGAVSEIAFSINNHNIVAGSYRDSANVEHGFFGPLAGSNWTTFDAPFDGTTGTEARSINDDGVIVGIATNPNFKVGEEFYRAPDGTFSVFEKDGVPLDGVASGINASGTSVGDYVNADGKTVGYIGQNGANVKDFKLHLKHNNKFLQVSPRGLFDNCLCTVGYYVDADGLERGLYQATVKHAGSVVSTFNYPSAVSTRFEDIDNSGIATGQWMESNGHTHAFRYVFRDNIKHPITDLDPDDGSTDQQAWGIADRGKGINNKGLIAVSTSIGRSYIYCPSNNAKHCPATGFLVKDRLQENTSSVRLWTDAASLRFRASTIGAVP